MSRKALGISGVLAAALAAVQLLGLDPSPEQRHERSSMNYGEVRATALVPTYVASLLLGAFRAVAVDVLWIQLDRMNRQEHRYFETVEIMEWITQLQPRNPQVYAYLASSMGFDIANQFRTEYGEARRQELMRELRSGKLDPDRARALKSKLTTLEERIASHRAQFSRWAKAGLRKLLDGAALLPDDPHLQHEIAHYLQVKASFLDGRFEEDFLRAIEEDGNLQEQLGVRGLNAFELSELWYDRALQTLRQLRDEQRFRYYRSLVERLAQRSDDERDYATTQLGLNLLPSTMDGGKRHVRYKNGALLWFRAEEALGHGDREEARRLLSRARDSFRRSEELAEHYRRTYPEISGLDMFKIYADLGRRLAELMEDRLESASLPPIESTRRAYSGTLSIRRDLVARGSSTADFGFVLERLSKVKKALGGDTWEYNDDLNSDAWTSIRLGQRIESSIGPDPDDIDIYALAAALPSHAHEGSGDLSRKPLSLILGVRSTGAATLRVEVHRMSHQGLAEADRFEVRGADSDLRTIALPEPSYVFLTVQAADPSAAAGMADRTYVLEAAGVQHR